MTEKQLVAGTPEDYQSLLIPEKLPKHVAIIMDGNGRWARSRHMPRLAGHRAGIKTVRKIVRIAGELGVNYLTLYAFSVENWRRPKTEVAGLMRLLKTFLRREIKELHRQQVKVTWIGNIYEFPKEVVEELHRSHEITRDNQGLVLNLALNYGARREITEAVRRIAAAVKAGQLEPDDIDERLFSEHLYTASTPDPDLIIRTSGEIRLSNFLLWQAAYTEFWITEIFWPSFTENDFCHALYDFQNRARRFGGIISTHGSVGETD